MTNYITNVGVQQFSITIAASSTTGTATINAVGSGAFVLFGGQYSSDGSNDTPNTDIAYLTLTNSTTITATRNTADSSTITLTGCIIDGDTTNLIKSVQYGTVTIVEPANSGTATISTVTNTNTAIHLLGHSSSNGSGTGYNSAFEYVMLSLSGTTVTASCSSSFSGTGTLVVGFVVIEFQGSCLNQSVQNIAAVASGNVSSYTTTINSVVLNNTLCIYAGSQCNDGLNTFSRDQQYGVLTNSTTFTISTNTASNNAKKYNCSIVEFAPGVLHSAVQRGTTSLSSTSSNTTTITGVNAANSAISFLNNITNNGTTNMQLGWCTSALTNGTTVTVVRGGSTGTLSGSWEIADFSPNSPSIAQDSLWFGMTF